MPSIRGSPKKLHLQQLHGHRDHSSGCRCTLLNILLGATVFVALNILFSYPYLKSYGSDNAEFSPPKASSQTNPYTARKSLNISGSVVLPSFSSDDSEIFMGSLIERGDSNSNADLHLTTFLLNHHMLSAEVKKAVHSSALSLGRLNNTLSKLGAVVYKVNGQRSDQPIHVCKIKNSRRTAPYVVPGMFLPNRQNVDPNANRRVDILRCGIMLQESLQDLLYGGEVAEVEIYRGRQLLHNFNISWRERRAGYMLTSPSDASKWDPWKGQFGLGINQSELSEVGGAAQKDAIYLCVPAIRRPPSRVSIGPLLEFVEHHVSIGVAHIFLGAAFSWDSPHMSVLLQLFKSYIDEGLVTIISEAGDGIDFSSSFLGLRFSRGDTKTFFNNMCLFVAKGSATYAAFWDVDQFFIPAGSVADIGNLLSNLHSAENTVRLSRIIPTHPMCYFSVSVREYYPTYAIGYHTPWVGDRFAYEPARAGGSPSRAIVPTKNIFSAGILTAGTCRMDFKYTSCKQDDARSEFCLGFGSYGASTHNFDQRMGPDDILNIPEKSGVLHHYQTYAQARLATVPESSQSNGNRYSKSFFPKVLKGLKKRGLEAMISIPVIEIDANTPGNVGWNEFVSDGKNADFDVSVATTDLIGDFFDSPEELNTKPVNSLFAAGSLEPLGVVDLPEFANDYSELFISSMLERQFDSPDLRVTIFLMNHAQLLRKAVSGVNVISINRTMKPVWDTAMRAFVNAKYLPTGERAQTYHCRVSLSRISNSTVYSSKGRFMPNRLTPDANANRKLDVLRCPLGISSEDFEKYYRSDEVILIEVLRDDTPLIHFSIPWKSRRTGFMLTSPPGGSGFDAWKGAKELFLKNKTLGPKKTAANDHYGVVDNLYMCVPGMESPFDKRVLPLYAEFVEHHMQLGVDHMFISATYDLNGANMKLLSSTFRSYIDDGLMTLSSQAGDMKDFRYGFKGLTFDRDNIKVMFVNMCLYMAKGSADYVAIWDFDEFFIPKLPHNSILDVIKFVEGSTPVPLPKPDENIQEVMVAWKKGPGVADGDGHPFCYLIVNSETINSDGDVIDPDHPWIGERFSHDTEVTHLSFQKSILPTRKIFQAGLHIGGSCKLPFPWNGCSEAELAETEFCYRADKSVGVGALNKVTWINNSYFVDFMRFHAFDEGTSVDDAKRLDIDNDAIIYHIQAHRAHLVSNKEALNGPVNEYASRFFGNVMKKLRERGIVLVQTLPMKHAKDIVTASAYWDPIIPLLAPSFTGPTGPKKLTAPSGEAAPAGSNWKPTRSLVAETNRASKLPLFSADGKDYVLGAIIERMSDSDALFLTSFFLGHDMLDPWKKGDLHGTRVAESVKDQWVSFAKSKWPLNHKEPWMAPGGRAPEQYFCRIKNVADASNSYLVPAEIVPNKGTPDAGANRRLHIMRCKMQDTHLAYSKYRYSSLSVGVELLRNQTSLMQFSVPWISRKTGYTLDTVPGVSKLDAWKGSSDIEHQNGTIIPDKYRIRRKNDRDRLHMCVPGLESHPDKTSIPLYLEFIQHHLLLGVDHISLSAVFSWDSVPMDRLILLLNSFINDGSVSVSSQAGDGIDDVYSTSGLSWFRDNSKIFYLNMCVYHAKGNADYVGIWDFDEFFIPKPPHNSILDVLLSMEGSGRYPQFPKDADKLDPLKAKNEWKGGPGFADGHMHPFCYILLSSEVICSDNSDGGVFDYSKPWIGQRFMHAVEPAGSDGQHMAFKKSIVPTDRIFQVGLHMHGACSLPYPWNGCSRSDTSCYSNGTKEKMGASYTSNRTLVDFSFTHSIDETVWETDTKKVDTQHQGVIYHFQVNRNYLAASEQALVGEANDYAKYFFPRVMAKLKQRGYVLLENFPETFGSKLLYDDPKVYLPWKPIFSDFLQKMRVRELFP